MEEQVEYVTKVKGRIINFTIPGRPVPAARMTRRGKWVKQNAQRYIAFKDFIRWTVWEIMRQKQLAPLEGPIGIEMHFYIAGGRMGDIDNLEKAVNDGLNGVAWYDDNQIVEAHSYRHKGKPQRTEVKIWEV